MCLRLFDASRDLVLASWFWSSDHSGHSVPTVDGSQLNCGLLSLTLCLVPKLTHNCVSILVSSSFPSSPQGFRLCVL